MNDFQNEDLAWLDYRNRFAGVYDTSNYHSPLQARTMHASHRLIERNHGSNESYSRVLEIGAGTGEHLQFVRHNYEEYVVSDIDDKALEVAQKKLSGDKRISYCLVKGQEVEYPNASFDRVVAVHVLEHIPYPHLAIKEWIRVLKPGGILSVLLPTDPGLAWRLARRLGPRKRALAQGIDYDYVMAREHVNPCSHLISLLRHYLPLSREAWWPTPIPSVDVNLFFAFDATNVTEKNGAASHPEIHS